MLAFSPRVIVQPDDGVGPVREFVASAEKSLLIKQFTFTEESLLQTVIARHQAGVEVRVMLNPARSGGDVCAGRLEIDAGAEGEQLARLEALDQLNERRRCASQRCVSQWCNTAMHGFFP